MTTNRSSNYLSVAALVLFVTTASGVARADINGTTTYAFYNNTQFGRDPYWQPQVGAPRSAQDPFILCGSQIGASKLEFLEKGIEVVKKLKSLAEDITKIISNPADIGAWTSAFGNLAGSYQAVNEMVSTAGDKVGVDANALVLDTTLRNYNEVELTFRIQTDDDPLWSPRVVVPRGVPGFRVLSVQPSPNSSTKPGSSAVVSVDLRRLPRSAIPYPVAFSAKEDDCRTCLAVSHTVFIFWPPCTRPASFEQALCNSSGQTLSWADRERDRLRVQLTVPANDPVRAAYAGRKKLADVCFKSKCKGTAIDPTTGRRIDRSQSAECRETDCPDPASPKQLCPSLAFEVSRPTCDKLAAIQRQIDDLSPRKNVAVRQAIATTRRCNCCNPVVNPTGNDVGKKSCPDARTLLNRPSFGN